MYGVDGVMVRPPILLVKGQGDVDVAGLHDRLAGVDALDLGQLFLVLLDQVGQLEQQAPALVRGELRPGAAVEGAAGRLRGAVDVLLGAVGGVDEDSSRGRVGNGDGLPALGGEPVLADQVVLRPGEIRRDLWLGDRADCLHHIPLFWDEFPLPQSAVPPEA
jgi:hypothetical protein